MRSIGESPSVSLYKNKTRDSLDASLSLHKASDFMKTTVITARKRNLGQGNMFTGVCLSTGGCLVWGVPGLGDAWSGGCLVGGVPGPGGAWLGGVPGPGGGGGLHQMPPWTATAAGGTHLTGMHSCWRKKYYEKYNHKSAMYLWNKYNIVA